MSEDDHSVSVEDVTISKSFLTGCGVVREVRSLNEDGDLENGGLKLIFDAGVEGDVIPANGILVLQDKNINPELRGDIKGLEGEEVIITAEDGTLSSLTRDGRELYSSDPETDRLSLIN